MKHYPKISFLLLSLLMFQCSVQKRHYRSGYHLERHHTLVTKEIKKEPVGTAALKGFERPNNTAVTALNAEPLLAPPDSCDVLQMRDGSSERVRVRQIDKSEIKYQRCDHLSGPVYVISTKKVARVNYYNGSVDEFKLEPETSPLPPNQKDRTSKEKIRKETTASSILSVILSSLDLGALLVILFLSLFALLLGTAIHLPAILFIALIAVALISTALAIYSLITIGKDKEHLKGIGNSVTAFILNIITILICLIALSIIFN